MESAKIRSAGVAVQRIRRARWAAWLALAACGGLSAAFPEAIGFLFYGILFAGLSLFGLYSSPPKPPPARKTQPAEVEVDHADLVFRTHGRVLDRISRATLVEGWLDSFRDDHRVVLRARGGDLVWIRVADRDEGRRLLRGLGFSVEQHLYTARLVSVASERLTNRARAALWIVAIYILCPCVLFPVALAFSGRSIGAGVLGPVAAILALLLYQGAKVLLPRTAVVGADGVTIKGFRKRSFIPFAGISRVWCDERGVWIQRPSGDPTLLATMARMTELPLVKNAPPSADTLVLLERVKEAMAAGDATSASAARFGALDRNGRPIAEWQRDLRALLEREGGSQGYRQTYLGRDELTGLVESAGAAPERRIAAALALSSVEDPAVRFRLRFAVDACANEDLRAALERAAHGEIAEAELERATQRSER